MPSPRCSAASSPARFLDLRKGRTGTMASRRRPAKQWLDTIRWSSLRGREEPPCRLVVN